MKKIYLAIGVLSLGFATYGLTMIPNIATAQNGTSSPSGAVVKPSPSIASVAPTPLPPPPSTPSLSNERSDRLISADSPNQISINTQAKEEVEQDTLTMTMRLTLTGTDPAILQSTLNQQMNDALSKVKPMSTDDKTKFNVKTGQVSTYPKFDKQRIQNWVGVGEIILEGEDFSQVSKAANLLNNFVTANVGMSVSQAKIDSMKEAIEQKAVYNFKKEAQRMTELFGFKTYILKNANVNYQQPGVFFKNMAVPMAASAEIANAPPLNIEPGKMTLQADVSGTIVLFN